MTTVPLATFLTPEGLRIVWEETAQIDQRRNVTQTLFASAATHAGR